MVNKFALYIALLFFSMSALAVDKYSGSKFSATMNLIASSANEKVSDIAGSGTLNDAAYQFQVNYTLGGQGGLLGLIKSDYDYVSLRSFRFIDRYDSDCGNAGASQFDGLAALYGHRYMISNKAYQGLGFGWYAGGATGTDKYVEPACSGSGSESTFIPLAAAELFYIHNFSKNFYIEPGVLFAADSKNFDGISVFPQVIIGATF